MKDLAIGVFDSGLGGLTVVREIIAQLPSEEIVYFGDTARYPYGTKSPETVRRYALEDSRLLLGYGIKALVVACNTVSAVGMDLLADHLYLPSVGVVGPGARAAVKATRNGRIGVIGTNATISSGIYERQLHELKKGVHVVSRPAPLFVSLVEEGSTSGKVAELIAEEYLAEIREAGIDTLVLGCTHYPLLKDTISKVMGPGVTLVDSAEEVSRDVARMLEEKDLVRSKPSPPSHRFIVSDDPERLKRTAAILLGFEPSQAELSI
ncbi:glutamate racemase [Candidatus Hydrogenedentota bacterium]